MVEDAARKHIAVALPDLDGGGAQRVLLELARGFLVSGASVDIVVLGPLGPLRDEVPTGARLVALGARRALTSVPALVRYLRKSAPHAVVAGPNQVNLAVLIATRLVRRRPWVVATHHNFLSVTTKHKRTRRDRAMPWILHFGYARMDRVVAVSRGVADDLARTAKLPRESIDVVYNPLDFARVARNSEARANHRWVGQRDRPLLLAVGRLTAQKDFGTLIRAVAALASARLLILGEGEDRTALQGLVEQLGLSDRVELMGYVANPMPFVRSADVFVLCSRWEGLPTVLIEALAFDTPIVATDCPSGPSEILEDGAWGTLVPMGDPAALARAIEGALDEPRRDRAPARTRFDLSGVTQQYLALLP